MANYTSTNTGANIDSAINQVIDSSTDLNVDSGTLVVDKSENKVGVGTTAPGQQLTVNNATASSATQGGGLRLQANDGAAMAQDHRLGILEFAGAEDASNNIITGASIQAFCDNNWSASENGTQLKFYTTDGNNSHTEVLCMYADNHLLVPRIGSGTDSGRLYFYDTSNHQYIYGTSVSLFSIATSSNYIHAQSENVIWDGSQWYPNTDDSKNLGTGSYRWNDIYATNNTIQTSDEDLKESIADSSLGLSFINKLKPKSYKWKNTPEQKYGDNEPTGDDNKKAGDVKQAEVVHTRKHYGLIAQDVKTTLDELSVATKDFAGYIDPSANGGSGNLGLRYSEFIAPMIKAIQELSAKVTALENG